MSFLMGGQKKPRQQKPATTDEAKARVEASADLNRRRGTGANILGGLTDSAPQTGAAKLLGGSK